MNTFIIISFLIFGAVTGDLNSDIDYLHIDWKSLPRVNFSLADAQKSDVIYTLFTNSFPNVGITITENNSNALITNKNIPTVLIMHGWTTDDTSPWYKPLRDAYLKQGFYNIIFLNWSKAGNKTYDISCANCKPVGRFIAEFLVASKVNLDKVHLVGHSLGSQLTAFIGKSILELTSRKIGRITALDPAGPKWQNSDMFDSERLTWRDADFVDIIHTDMRLFGFINPIGHVDFYPNQGKHQPGCPSYEEDYNCNHARSTLFFIDSVETKALAKEALFSEDNQTVLTITPQQKGKTVIFGENVNKNDRGVYYLITNPNKPFLNKDN